MALPRSHSRPPHVGGGPWPTPRDSAAPALRLFSLAPRSDARRPLPSFSVLHVGSSPHRRYATCADALVLIDWEHRRHMSSPAQILLGAALLKGPGGPWAEGDKRLQIGGSVGRASRCSIERRQSDPGGVATSGPRVALSRVSAAPLCRRTHGRAPSGLPNHEQTRESGRLRRPFRRAAPDSFGGAPHCGDAQVGGAGAHACAARFLLDRVAGARAV